MDVAPVRVDADPLHAEIHTGVEHVVRRNVSVRTDRLGADLGSRGGGTGEREEDEMEGGRSAMHAVTLPTPASVSEGTPGGVVGESAAIG